MNKRLLNKFKAYVDDTINNEEYKNKVYNIFNDYISSKKKKYAKTYEKEIVKDVLLHCVDEFKSRLNKLMSYRDNVLKFIDFIRENKYKYNASYLSGEDKALYNLINTDNFDVDEYILKNDSLDVFSFFSKTYNLAVRFGLPEKKQTPNDNLAFVDDGVPEAIKEGIKAVE